MNKQQFGFFEALEENIEISSLSFLKGFIIAHYPLSCDELDDKRIFEMIENDLDLKRKLKNFGKRNKLEW